MKALRIIIILLIITVISAVVYWFLGTNVIQTKGLYLVPKSSNYILKTDDPLKSWGELSNTQLWSHLRTNEFFKEMTEYAAMADSILEENKSYLNLLGEHELIISSHLLKTGEEEYLYIFDLAKSTGISSFSDLILSFLGDGFRITKSSYKEKDIYEIFDKENKLSFYASLIDNQVIFSATPILVKASIDNSMSSELSSDQYFIQIENDAPGGNLVDFYINYSQFSDLLKYYQDGESFLEPAKGILKYTAGSLSISDDDIMTMEGVSNFNKEEAGYLNAISKADPLIFDAVTIIPDNIGLFAGMSTGNLDEFMEGIERNMAKDSAGNMAYFENINRIEKFLGFDVKKDFASAFSNEVCYFQLPSLGLKMDKEMALVLESPDIKKAEEQLEYIKEKIRKRTPVKFNSVPYRDHTIHYLAVKGLFKVLLGKFFEGFDKPYYTIIDNNVVFSSHPAALRYIIDSYLEGSTLVFNNHYAAYLDRAILKSNLLIYVNTVEYLNSLKKTWSADLRKSYAKNNSYIDCFSNLGIQFIEDDDNKFKTKIISILDFNPPTLKNTTPKKRERSPFDDLAVENGIANRILLKALDKIYPNDLDANEQIVDRGKYRIVFEIKDGKKDGRISVIYKKSGEEVISGKYNEGEKDRKWKIYNNQGDLVEKIYFEAGSEKK